MRGVHSSFGACTPDFRISGISGRISRILRPISGYSGWVFQRFKVGFQGFRGFCVRRILRFPSWISDIFGEISRIKGISRISVSISGIFGRISGHLYPRISAVFGPSSRCVLACLF